MSPDPVFQSYMLNPYNSQNIYGTSYSISGVPDLKGALHMLKFKLVHKFLKHHVQYSGKIAVQQEAVKTEHASGNGQLKNNFQCYPNLRIIQITLKTIIYLLIIFSGADSCISLNT